MTGTARLLASRAGRRAALGFLLLLVAWEGSATLLRLPSYVLPSISDILLSIARHWHELAGAAAFTLAEALSGFGLGCAVGIGLAVLCILLPPLRAVAMPLATAVNSVPVVGYSPLILLWFGIGMVSKIVMVTLVVSFTLFVSTLAGLDRVDRRAVDLLRSFGAGRLQVLWRLRLPTALPLVAAGMRVSTVRCILLAIVTEMLGATDGLGWVIFQAVLQIDFVRVWSAIFVASAASLAFFALVGFGERRIVFWR